MAFRKGDKIMTEETMKQHCDISPSQYPSLARCEWFEPDNKKSDDAIAGTNSHNEVANCLQDNDYINECEDETALGCVKYVLSASEGCTVQSELRLEGKDELDGIWGTADVVWVDDVAVHIVDYKTFSRTTGWYLPQLIGYAALYATQYVPREMWGSTMTHLHIYHGGSGVIEEMVLTMAEAVEKTLAVINRTRENRAIENRNIILPYAKCTANKGCKHCKNLGKCGACKGEIQSAQTVLSTVPKPWHRMSLCEKVAMAEVIEPFFEQAKEELKLACRSNGGEVWDGNIGYKLKVTAPSAKMPSPAEVANKLSLSVDNIFNASTITKANVVKLLRANGYTKDGAEEAANSIATFGKEKESLVKIK
jgi:hypothetical protein